MDKFQTNLVFCEIKNAPSIVEKRRVRSTDLCHCCHIMQFVHNQRPRCIGILIKPAIFRNRYKSILDSKYTVDLVNRLNKLITLINNDIFIST